QALGRELGQQAFDALAVFLDQGALGAAFLRAAEGVQRRAAQALRERLAERGGTVVAIVGVATADFAPFVAQNGDGVFLGGRGAAARGVVPKLALAGL
ncbi:hypothetical protein OH413_24330, partial [Salmonella enterica]|nr:hypothetical protein [Salmonella enterica]